MRINQWLALSIVLLHRAPHMYIDIWLSLMCPFESKQATYNKQASVFNCYSRLALYCLTLIIGAVSLEISQ